ncbi:hypothetical protein CGZ80_18395 [Rhodopirellula sp. MGV]|nr:hypothetical protein CGZ80_18395 [Rhodopirellula sp. MGV]PNY35190.1 hypothetical protein C2E31_19410 [Rhodopirellula baltica]
MRRPVRPQVLERRELFAADPIHVGVVYLETDYLESDNDVGSDSQGDKFLLSFTGGAEGTTLNRIRISTDKDGDGLSIGDPIFDTQVGGRGKLGAHDFKILKIETTDGRVATATATVADGGQELILDLTNFRSGDRLEFTIDVDEVLRMPSDLDEFNDRLDVITSGQEFQDSILEAFFEAPHYEPSVADVLFINDYESPQRVHGLNLPDDDGTGPDSRPNRSAAALGQVGQTPMPISISGSVWLDNNHDSVWQPSEMGLADVELTLLAKNANGNYVDTGHRVFTDANGHYEFDRSLGLMPGNYQIAETQPVGLYSVAAIPGTVEGVTTGFAESVDVLSSIEISLGDTDAINMNFAEAQSASIGGYVYRDSNDNGIREAGETGIPGVQIKIVPVQTISPQETVSTVTLSDGSYYVANLAPGTYEIIEVTQPQGLLDGKDTAGTISGVTVGLADVDGDAIRGIDLNGGVVGIEYNFGEIETGEISGAVYLARPGQACYPTYDPNLAEPLGGVIVELREPDGNVVSRVTTTPMGVYRFDDVPPGEYKIYQYTPDGLLDGTSYAGQIDGVTNGQAVDGTLIRQISMTPGGIGTDYHFCEIAPVKMSGYVYHDRSMDGSRDAGEEGIANTTVSLVDDSGATVATTQTDANGYYQFENLEPGNYTLVEQQPQGYLDGLDRAGMIGGQTVGVAGDDRITQIELPQGMAGVEYNFGELLPASIGGHVHVDLDGDCIRDPNEVGLNGVTIQLLDEDGNVVRTTQTAIDGIYRFNDLQPGRYTVVEIQPEGFFDGGVKAGSEGGVVSTNRISEIDLGTGINATDYDFCEEPPSSLSGTVHVDNDGDCIKSPFERGIQGVLIELRDGSGTVVATTRTDADGNYQFVGLRGGDYTVFEVQPEGYFQGGQVLGSAGGAVIGVDLMAVSLAPGQDAVDYMFCEYEPASLSGTVWSDTNTNQRMDPDEDPIAEVIVKLIDESGNVVQTTKTDINGFYKFTGLDRGLYAIQEVQPETHFHGGQIVGNLGGRPSGDDHLVNIQVGAGLTGVGYDFPEIPPAEISGVVFIDGAAIETTEEIPASDLRQYKDGQLTSDDTRLNGVRITILNEFGEPLSDDAFLSGDAVTQSVVFTDQDGVFQFKGLRPGTYVLSQTQPSDDGLQDSIDTPGTTGGLAVNEADEYSEFQTQWIRSVVPQGNSDTILGVHVSPGQVSNENLFSEVRVNVTPVEPPPPPPPPPPPEEPPHNFLTLKTPEPESIAPPVIEYFKTPDPIYSIPVPERVFPPSILGEVDFVTWHLSVINGGHPRGQIASSESFLKVAMRTESGDDGTGHQKDRGSWKLLTIDGQVRQESEAIQLGAKDAIGLAGDFNGDGTDEVAIYIEGHWYVDMNGNGVWDEGDLWIMLGTEMDRPVVGDWDGDGKDDIGIFGRKWERDWRRIKAGAGLPDPSNRWRRFLENRKTLGLVSIETLPEDCRQMVRNGDDASLRADAVDHVFQYGEDVDTPITGDWNGDGIDQIGIFRAGIWVLDAEGDGRRKLGEERFEFGKPGDTPIVGDFDGDGIDEIGVIRGRRVIIDTDGDRQITAADDQFDLPEVESGSQPVVGDWDGDGRDELGWYRDAG